MKIATQNYISRLAIESVSQLIADIGSAFGIFHFFEEKGYCGIMLTHIHEQTLLAIISLLGSLTIIVPAHGGSAVGTLTVSANVPPRLEYRVTTEPNTLTIKTSDIEQGHKVENNVTAISIQTNSASGYTLVIRAQLNSFFSKVRISVDDDAIPIHEIAPGGRAEIHFPSSNGPTLNDKKRLSFDFFLTPGIEAGKYQWPISVLNCFL